MLIRTGEEEHIVTEQSLKTSPDIADCRRVDMTDMGTVIDVVDRCRDVAFGAAHRAWMVASSPREGSGPKSASLAAMSRFCSEAGSVGSDEGYHEGCIAVIE